MKTARNLVPKRLDQERFTLDEVVSNPFTSIYWDYQTNTYWFCVLGKPIAQMDKNGKVTSLVEKRLIG